MAPEPISGNDFRFLQQVLRQTCGLVVPEKRREQAAEVVRNRMAELELTHFRQYRCLLESCCGPDERMVLAGRLAVGETYFFRHPSQWRVLQRCVFPWIAAQRDNTTDRRLRLWSAGCSTGEEAYTLAIVARQAFPEDGRWQIEVIGTDISEPAIAAAKKAYFSERSFRGVPEGLRTAYFEATSDGRQRPIKEARQLVRFECLNLLDGSPPCRDIDVVFCRNVLIYFAPEDARRVVAKMSQCLRSGGYLFLGQSERLERWSNDFATIRVGDTFFYKKLPGSAGPLDSGSRGAGRVRCGASGVLRRSSERHPRSQGQPADSSTRDPLSRTAAPSSTAGKRRRLSVGDRQGPPEPRGRAANPGPQEQSPEVESLRTQAMAHLCAEDLQAAAEALEDLLRLVPEDTQALLGRALLKAGEGDCEEAVRCCRKVLAKEPLCAEAHYLLALVHEARGNESAAMSHLEKSFYLDRHFAAASFRLGCLLERLGRIEAASAAYRGAMNAIDRDSELRIRLYSGGLGPDAFRRLCEDRLRTVSTRSGEQDVLVGSVMR